MPGLTWTCTIHPDIQWSILLHQGNYDCPRIWISQDLPSTQPPPRGVDYKSWDIPRLSKLLVPYVVELRSKAYLSTLRHLEPLRFAIIQVSFTMVYTVYGIVWSSWSMYFLRLHHQNYIQPSSTIRTTYNPRISHTLRKPRYNYYIHVKP